MTKELKESWIEINGWLERNAPKIKQALNPPATKSDLNKLEEIIEAPLPEDLVSLYSIHNGTNALEMANFIYGIPFLPIEDTIREIENNNSLEVEKLIYADKGINKEYLFSQFRIPIGSDSGTCLLCVDLKPIEGGQIGQVILLDYEKNTALSISKSIKEMYSMFAKNLNEGEYTLSEDALEDGVEWLEPSKEFDIINWHNTTRWGSLNK